jgi:hypothetical protein
MLIVLSKSTKASFHRLLRLQRSSKHTTTTGLNACSRALPGSISSQQKHLSTSSNVDEQSKAANSSSVTFPLATKVVICGGGLFGTSIAYHLGQLGYKDVVLVTRDRLGSGASRFSTGLVETIKVSTTETLLSKYTANLYQKLQSEDHDLSNLIQIFFKQTDYANLFLIFLSEYERVGSIGLAASRDRWHTIRRQVSETK